MKRAILFGGIYFLLVQKVASQVSFGQQEEEEELTGDVNTRLGLAAGDLGLHPLGEQNGQEGRVPTNGNLKSDSCCCSSSNSCPDANDRGGDVFDFIKPRGKEEPLTSLRIVNNPVNEEIEGICPRGTRQCCYPPDVDILSFGSSCAPRKREDTDVFWNQACRERVFNFRGKQCGQRNFQTLSNLRKGEASPEEFPWTCLMLTDKDRFLGSCAIVPESTNNDIRDGTSIVITAAHKLKDLKQEEGLKVRIIEYDASGIKDTERNIHQEYLVVRFETHPNFNPKRLTDDIAVLVLERKIDLYRTDGVNAACYPACGNMFDYQFQNSTGVRCWVAGWGKTSETGQFSFIQRKVDVPIYQRNRCSFRMRQALSRATGKNSNFQLDSGEICAGGEQNKDSCEGDGGAPLVCQSVSGHWHVVGLVAWGVGCGEADTPGVYVNVYHYLDFITSPRRRTGK